MYSVALINYNLFIHMYIDEHMGYFQFGVFMKKAPVYICLPVFVWAFLSLLKEIKEEVQRP